MSEEKEVYHDAAPLYDENNHTLVSLDAETETAELDITEEVTDSTEEEEGDLPTEAEEEEEEEGEQ